MNRWIGIGRLTADPQLRYTPNGKAVTNFTVAIGRPFVNRDGERDADFIPVVVWGKLAEVCANNLGKGHLVGVEGRVQTRRYEHDGQMRTAVEVIAENVRFLDWPKDRQARGAIGGGGGLDDFSPDDVPF